MLHFLNHYAAKAAIPTRRSFLKMSAGAAGGLVLGLPLARLSEASAASGDGVATPFVRISPDNLVTVICKHLDMGQANSLGLATLVAEELDASPDQIRIEFAPANAEVYKNLLFGVQGTGGSTAIPNSYEQYRTAGATARAMLIAAAAKDWGVEPGVIAVARGEVTAGNRRASFGDLAVAAGAEAVPAEATLKTPDQWVYIGKDFPRPDMDMKIHGSVGAYGMDKHMDGMVVAVTARPPRFGGTVSSVDSSAAEAMPGVAGVLTIPQGVAVLAETTWQAIQARDALIIEWDDSAAEMASTADLETEYRKLATTAGLKAMNEGDVEAALAAADKVVEAEYVFPYLAHTPMEPLDITIMFDGSSAEVWTGSQLQTLDHNITAGVLGLDPANVSINTLWAGGSFGRRAIANSHYAAEAATIAKAWLGAGNAAVPIKLIYTREDDVKGGYYRPMHVHRVRAGVNADGQITGWQHTVVGQGLLIGTPFEDYAVHDGVDHSSIEGVNDMVYAREAFSLDVHHPSPGIPVLWWRAVGHTHTAYAVESMIDELAEAAGEDPVAFRLRHLPADDRRTGVLKLAAEKAGWDTPPAEGRHRGVAVHKSFNSYVAEIAEVSLREDGTVKVEKVVAAVDCGVPINPDNIVAQVEGGIGYGLSAVLREELTLTDGEVDQSNFYDYTPLRISDMPEIEVHIVQSAEAPTGIGEPGTPPIGPAVANAAAKATGNRVRSLPFSKHGLA